MQARAPEGRAEKRELVEWGRLFVWIGALVLLTESITGRGIGLMTVLAAIGMSGGLLVLLAGLIWPARPTQSVTQVEGPPAVGQEPQLDSAPQGPADTHLEASTAVIEAAQPEPEAEAPAVYPPAAEVPVRIETLEVREGDALVGMTCVRCTTELQVGDLAAECPRCGGKHHAACWTGNRFHCATPGCSGAASLEAPSTRATP